MIILDANYLAWRAYYAHTAIHDEGQATGVVFGFLRDIPHLLETCDATRVVFCFDAGSGKRREIAPDYKGSRAPKDEDAAAVRAAVAYQIGRLRDRYLPRLGYRNIFSRGGYEADDVIASVANNLPGSVQGTIVSGDADLYQLLRPGVRIYNPRTRRHYGHEAFRAEWGIEPVMWAHVKAAAGCATDDVAGIRGIGEKTAARWAAGTLPHTTAAHAKIMDGLATMTRNLQLVTLPFPGVGEFDLRPDKTTPAKLAAVAGELGMPSLITDMPRGVRKRETSSDETTGFGLSGTR
jgi:5'-3' exonuclease